MIRPLLTAILALPPLACHDPAAAEPVLGADAHARHPALDIDLVSAHGDARSHAVGDNCMRCHQPRGPGPGLFTAAGTLHDDDGSPHPGGAIELRSAPDGMGELVARLEVDALGNFYT